jgi:hypothetical protein
MKTQFNEKDTIHYMDDNKPKTGVITGISMKKGKCNGISYNFDISEGEILVEYYVEGHYYGIKDTDAFETVKALQDSVFSVELIINE